MGTRMGASSSSDAKSCEVAGLGGRKEIVSTCYGEEGVGYTMVYNEKPRSSGCSSSEQKSLGFTKA